jgi:hypothetical protein
MATNDFARMAFPNESLAYREARNALLDAEIALRRQTEAVAAMRRRLPPGGEVPENYVFERIGAFSRPEPVNLSELFGEHSTLLLYSYMFGPEKDLPCPGCTHLIDGFDGAARHVPQRAAFYVVSRSPIARLAAWAHARGWDHVKLLSTAGNSYPLSLLRQHFPAHPVDARRTRLQVRRGLGRADAQRLPQGRRRDPPFLGQRAGLRARRSGAESSRARSGRSALGPARHDARGARGLLPQSELRRTGSFLMLALYGHPFSSYTWKALIALYANETEFEFRVVDADHPEHLEFVQSAGPLGKFPVLPDGENVIFESTSIIEYLSQRHATNQVLVPDEPSAALGMRMLDRVFDNYVMNVMQIVVDEYLRDRANPDQTRIAEARER